MILTQDEKAAFYAGFRKCDCGRPYPTTFIRHPEKGWCCRCCGDPAVPIGLGEWIQTHYKKHHVAPDMMLPENFWKALCTIGAEKWEKYEGAVFLEVCGRAGAVRDALANLYDEEHPEEQNVDGSTSVRPEGANSGPARAGINEEPDESGRRARRGSGDIRNSLPRDSGAPAPASAANQGRVDGARQARALRSLVAKPKRGKPVAGKKPAPRVRKTKRAARVSVPDVENHPLGPDEKL